MADLSRRKGSRDKIAHIIATRFAVKIQFARPRDTDEDWIEERLGLLERYALPSIAAQSCQDFTWLLAVSTRAPERPIERLGELLRKSLPPGRAKVVLLTDDHMPTAIIEEARLTGAQRILTSRFDSDDALHVDYAQDLRAACEASASGKRFFLDFTEGYSLNHQNLDLLTFGNECNPFVSLIEPNNSAMTTIYCGNHKLIQEKGPVLSIAKPRWMQIFHGGNQLNRHQGNNLARGQNETVLRNFGLGHLVSP